MSLSVAGPQREQSFLEVKGLRKRFGATLALDNVRIAFQRGRVHCVLGENGAGKSTLGKIIGGVYTADAGAVLIDGREVEIGSVARARELGVAVVFQELSLAPDLSVRANLMLGIERRGHLFARVRAAEERRRAQEVLDKLEVAIGTEERVGDLPVAMQQMIEVAKALVRQPRMIILDEPTAMLSEPDKRRLFAVIHKLRSDGTALAFITHHMEDVHAVADIVSIMRDGRVVDSFSVSDTRDSSSILEKLSGTRAHRRSESSRATSRTPTLSIAGLRDRAGNAASVEVASGEIVGLYGVAGCGAERLARALVGLAGSTEVSATFNGEPLLARTPAQARRRGIAYLPTGRARHGILPGRPIRENLNVSQLKSYARLGVVSRRLEANGTHAQLTANAVKFGNIEDDITVLSGGNQQKVLMARVLAAGSRLLVLEDPTAGIDIEAKRQIQQAIRARAAAGAAVILISSDLLETIEMVDTLYTLYAGKIVHCYSPPRFEDRGAIVADVIGQGPSAVDYQPERSSIADDRSAG